MFEVPTPDRVTTALADPSPSPVPSRQPSVRSLGDSGDEGDDPDGNGRVAFEYKSGRGKSLQAWIKTFPFYLAFAGQPSTLKKSLDWVGNAIKQRGQIILVGMPAHSSQRICKDGGFVVQ